MLWSPLWELANRYGISVYRFVPLVVSTSQSFPNSWLITGLVTKVTRRVSLVEHDLLTIPEHPSSPRDFSGIHFAQFFVFCIALCRSLFVVGHCLSFFDLRILIPLWYLQNLLKGLNVTDLDTSTATNLELQA